MAATDFDFSETRTQILEGALRKVGAMGFGKVVSGEEMVVATNQLNAMIKEWQTKNIFLWQLVVKTVSLTANVATVAVPTDPGVIGIDSAAWVNGTEHTPIEIISWRDYQEIPTKTDQGNPTKLTLDNARNGTIYTYPVVTATTTLRLVVISKLKDWDTAAGNGDFPEHWMMALVYGLAAYLADDYGVPLDERRTLQAKADYLFGRAKGSDRDRADLTVVRGSY